MRHESSLTSRRHVASAMSGFRVTFRATILILAGLSLAVPALSQQGEGSEMTRQQMQTRIMQQFDREVQRELGLSDSEAASVREISIRHHGYRVELMRDRRALHRSIREFMDDGGSEMQARRLIRQMRAFREREGTIEDEEREALLDVLSHSQLLRLHVLREEFTERIRNLEGRRDSSRSGRGGGSSRDLWELLY